MTNKFYVVKGIISYMNTAKRLLCVSEVYAFRSDEFDKQSSQDESCKKTKGNEKRFLSF